MDTNILKIMAFIIYRFVGYYLPKSNTILIGKISKRIRYILIKILFKKVGKNINIERRAWFGFGKNIEIGNNSGIGINAIIPSDTIIGENVMMGPDCLIYEANHKFDRIDIPMCKQGHEKTKQTIIGNDVWIGGRVIILPGKKIGNHAIIGSGSVVTKNLDDYGIYGGNPAKLIRMRK